MALKREFKYTISTLKFSIAGLLIPGFTAIIILGLQMGIQHLGVECSNSWLILWIITSIGAMITPLIFARRLKSGNLPSKEIHLFNIIEYTFLQCMLASFFTSGQTLCYVTDGQNGLEFVFTGWMAIPILIIFSLAMDLLSKRKV